MGKRDSARGVRSFPFMTRVTVTRFVLPAYELLFEMLGSRGRILDDCLQPPN